MRKAFVILLTVLTLSVAMPAIAEEGRYQAIQIESSGSMVEANVFIIDTQEGHLWMWMLLKDPSNQEVPVRTTLFYQGKVDPETKPGKRIYIHEPLHW